MRWMSLSLVVVLLVGPSCGDEVGKDDAPNSLGKPWSLPAAIPAAEPPPWAPSKLLSLPIELPRIASVEGDDTKGSSEGDDVWMSITVGADGDVHAPHRHPKASNPAFPFSSADPGEQDDAIQQLLARLRDFTHTPELREPGGSSRVRMLIYADRRAKWKYVQWVMQVCAHPDLKIYRLSFPFRYAGAASADSEDAALPLVRFDSELPTDRELAPIPHDPEERASVKIKVFRRDLHDHEKAYTVVKVDRSEAYALPRAWRGRAREPERVAEYDTALAAIRVRVEAAIKGTGADREEITGEVVAPPPKGGSVPFGDVMEMLGILRQAGITNVVYEGAATPLTARERAARRDGGR